MGRPRLEMVMPKITAKEVIKYAKAGGYDGVDTNYGSYLTNDEQCYCMFMYEIDQQLIGERGNRELSVKEIIKDMTTREAELYLQGRIDQLIYSYTDKYVRPAMEKKKHVTVDERDLKGGLSSYVVQYLLRINGFSIDTEVDVHDHKNFSELADGNGNLPIKFVGTFADENEIKERMNVLGVKGNSTLESYMPKARSLR